MTRVTLVDINHVVVGDRRIAVLSPTELAVFVKVVISVDGYTNAEFMKTYRDEPSALELKTYISHIRKKLGKHHGIIARKGYGFGYCLGAKYEYEVPAGKRVPVLIDKALLDELELWGVTHPQNVIESLLKQHLARMKE